MLVRYSDWRKPTDDGFAFALLPRAAALPSPGTRTDIREVAREVLGEAAALRLEQKVRRWAGPEDVDARGAQPYAAPQRLFEERLAPARLTLADVETALRGTALVLRRADGRTDYLLRDHHMVDVALYHYATTGELPAGLFHADRHSDWCRDALLEQGAVDQAATWWKLLEGLKRPGSGEPVLRESQVAFANARAAQRPWMPGREAAGSLTVPGSLDPTALGYEDALAREGALEADWLSVDLDYLQPSPQLRLAGGLLREARFAALLAKARVRVFVLSPQFTRGGDRFERWVVHGSRASSLRLLNLLRR